MDDIDVRWYEWLMLPGAIIVGVIAAIVLGVIGAAKLIRPVFRLIRRKMRSRVAVRSSQASATNPI